MSELIRNKDEELQYLENTIKFLNDEIDRIETIASTRKSRLVEARREMWENTNHNSKDFEKLTEMNQHLDVVNNMTGGYINTLKIVENYRKALSSPYFGRFDFSEKDYNDVEKIYVGLHGMVNPETYNVLVYDWRAPVCSIFYQYELGNAKYQSPMGDIYGEVLLKRQYKIENSELKYYFDSSIRITDEILQEALYKNASAKMRNIVETIQREQDRIIRDMENELLIVQGVAGSGKTSIALHRIAYLLYNGMNLGLKSSNVIIVSPNNIFSKYISSVLPELGEENVMDITFDDIVKENLNGRFAIEDRAAQLEALILTKDESEHRLKEKMIEFKGSSIFSEIINRMIKFYERRMIPVEDIYYDGKIIETKQRLKNMLLNNKIDMPMAKRLNRIERIMLQKIHPLRKNRIKKIEGIVEKSDGHELEIRSFSRLLQIKESKGVIDRLRRFTKVDYYELYKKLFESRELFMKLSMGLKLPDEIDKIIEATRENLNQCKMFYEDSFPLIYLKLKLEGNDGFSEIQQVVIDEAQDYYPIQYKIFRLLFKNARYTVLGDINQTLEKDSDISIYDNISQILNKRICTKLFLNKSYRSSSEINEFNKKLLDKGGEFEYFERFEEEPVINHCDSIEMLNDKIAQDINRFREMGYESIAVICRTMNELDDIYLGLRGFIDIRTVNSTDIEIEKGVYIIPAYIAKGLEFDVVIMYDVSEQKYSNRFDRKLLYIGCSRALHRLVLYYTGEKSTLI